MFSSAAIHIPVPKIKPRIVPRSGVGGDEVTSVRPNYFAAGVVARNAAQDSEEGGTAYDYTDYIGWGVIFGLVLLFVVGGVFVARRYRKITRL